VIRAKATTAKPRSSGPLPEPDPPAAEADKDEAPLPAIIPEPGKLPGTPSPSRCGSALSDLVAEPRWRSGPKQTSDSGLRRRMPVSNETLLELTIPPVRRMDCLQTGATRRRGGETDACR
jgi:hypothetical protein